PRDRQLARPVSFARRKTEIGFARRTPAPRNPLALGAWSNSRVPGHFAGRKRKSELREGPGAHAYSAGQRTWIRCGSASFVALLGGAAVCRASRRTGQALT